MSLQVDTSEQPKGAIVRNVSYLIAVLLIGIGLMGKSHAAVGYALFLIATTCLLGGLISLAVFALSSRFDTKALRRTFTTAFRMGAWTYIFAVSAFIGYYTYEALVGHIPFRYILFGPAILVAIVILDVGIWRIVVQRNMPTFQRFGGLWTRDRLDQKAMSRTLVDEVVLHRSLFSTSAFRWLRHQLIFWGFGLMFLTELLAVMFREAFPAFGWTDVWHVADHPVRLAFDLVFDLTGLMMLIGCLLALIFRVMVNGTDAQKFTDTPTTLFLFIVVVTGFMIEGAHLGSGSVDPATAWASFVGWAFIPISPTSSAAIEILWVTHALAACGFIAYIPLKRLIHSCATPLGRLATSQEKLMSEKKENSIKGLLGRFGHQ